MFEPTRFFVFVGTSLALLVAPGPAVLFVVARSMEQGRWAGIVSSLGLAAGTLVHLFAVTVGLSAIILTSATLYAGLKFAGAAYLIHLGVRELMSRQEAAPLEGPPAVDGRRLLYQGIVVNILNPKPALFFLAFLPQFVDPDRGRPVLQLTVLGFTFILLGLVTDSIYAMLAGTAGGWLKRRSRFGEFQRYVTGSVYIALGVLTATSGGHRRG